jgi:osmotically-inducible protein OsmY
MREYQNRTNDNRRDDARSYAPQQDAGRRQDWDRDDTGRRSFSRDDDERTSVDGPYRDRDWQSRDRMYGSGRPDGAEPDRWSDSGRSQTFNHDDGSHGYYERDADRGRGGGSYDSRSDRNLYGRGQNRMDSNVGGTGYSSARDSRQWNSNMADYAGGEGGGRSWNPSDGRGPLWSQQWDQGQSSWSQSQPPSQSSWGQPQSRGSMQSGHAGKGPKGYQRSDDRIREDLSDQLTASDQIDASNVEVECRNGEVTLSGTVDCKESKRLAEDMADGVPGVRQVNNQLRVEKPNGMASSHMSTQSNQSTRGSQTDNANREPSTQNRNDAVRTDANRGAGQNQNAGSDRTSKH